MIRRVSKKGAVVIPAELRQRYNLIPGTIVEIVDNGGVLTIVPKIDDLTHDGVERRDDDDLRSGEKSAKLIDEINKASALTQISDDEEKFLAFSRSHLKRFSERCEWQ